jgi:hypothetical protein
VAGDITRRFRRRARKSCGCKVGRPARYDCVPCQAVRLISEAIGRARADTVREMTPYPDWWLRDVRGGSDGW